VQGLSACIESLMRRQISAPAESFGAWTVDFTAPLVVRVGPLDDVRRLGASVQWNDAAGADHDAPSNLCGREGTGA
jgi:hypothetical protein